MSISNSSYHHIITRNTISVTQMTSQLNNCNLSFNFQKILNFSPCISQILASQCFSNKKTQIKKKNSDKKTITNFHMVTIFLTVYKFSPVNKFLPVNNFLYTSLAQQTDSIKTATSLTHTWNTRSYPPTLNSDWKSMQNFSSVTACRQPSSRCQCVSRTATRTSHTYTCM